MVREVTDPHEWLQMETKCGASSIQTSSRLAVATVQHQCCVQKSRLHRPGRVRSVLNCNWSGMAHLVRSCEDPYRSDLKPARTSSEKSFGCSQAAKCPPLGSLLK